MKYIEIATSKDATRYKIQERIAITICKKTGYRFPKHTGLFCRDSKSRKFLKALGVRVIIVNLTADLETITDSLK